MDCMVPSATRSCWRRYSTCLPGTLVKSWSAWPMRAVARITSPYKSSASRVCKRIPMVGTEFSNYRIVEKIGEGGMGVVYKAIDTSLDRVVAVKALGGELTRNAEL